MDRETEQSGVLRNIHKLKFSVSPRVRLQTQRNNILDGSVAQTSNSASPFGRCNPVFYSVSLLFM